MRRYNGNTGRYTHIPEEEHRPPERHPPPPPPPPKETPQQNKTPPPKSFGSGLQGFLSNIFAQGFDTEDLLLFAVLFLMYKESGDKELLIIMGGMFLL